MPEKEKHFRKFQEILQWATKSMHQYYFRIAMANLRGHCFRERVYCYELYHQLRLSLQCFPYTLQGEMDKNGNPIIHREISAVKPDFILHEPGTMKNNLVVMEVKPLNNANRPQLKKDLYTLTRFLDLGYYRAIHLIYGSLRSDDGGISKIIRTYREYMNPTRLNAYRGKLLLYWHRNNGEFAIIYDWEREVFNNSNGR
jgi:hypothetical protein